MKLRSIDLFDTTLRDGTQGEGISLSSEDKLRIARRLDKMGIDYIEGGWPGSNPKDMDFFNRARELSFGHASLVAFGSTMRRGNTPETDPNIQALVQAGTPAVSIFGKTWLFHVRQALGISEEENLELIRQSVGYMASNDKEVIYDAEHFFDGYKDNSAYALSTLEAAAASGASVLVLCDTNGGTLPQEVADIVRMIVDRFPDKTIGIHAHNDGELAVANTLAAVENGCRHVQGTINGYGERCGNVNLCSVIPNLQLKLGYECMAPEQIEKLTSLSHFVSEVANVAPFDHQPFVGKSAFAHKGGIHVSAVMKDPSTYEHIRPEQIGNKRRVLVSDLSGKSNIQFKAQELGMDLKACGDKIPEVVQALKKLENEGYQFEAAEGSLDLLIRKITGEWEDLFELRGFRVIIEKNEKGEVFSEATIRLIVNGEEEHTAADGNGPVHALDAALRKAICKFYPEVDQMQLSDYKVRVLNEKDGTQARVRVLIDSQNNNSSWGTVGVSENIIEASWQALMESMAYYLQQHKRTTENHSQL
ncbi:citramalate synthase [Balneolales bacterium ANBcel1]|nr:citramalate synthase [Balneolales bacterium ANBcel1]